MKKRLTKIIPSLFSFVVLLALWEAVSHFSGWNDHVFPGPFKVMGSMLDLILDGTLLKHIIASLYRVTFGFYLAIITGIPLGILLGMWDKGRRLLNPVIHFLRPISPLAWIPLSMLWFGIGDKPAVFLIFLSSFFSLTVATTIAVSSINPVYFQVAASFNFSRRETISRIVLPAITPDVITALRMTVTIAWIVVVAAEMIAVQSGLGYLILDARNALRMDYVMDGMIVIGLIGIILDMLMKRMAALSPSGWR